MHVKLTGPVVELDLPAHYPGRIDLSGQYAEFLGVPPGVYLRCSQELARQLQLKADQALSNDDQRRILQKRRIVLSHCG